MPRLIITPGGPGGVERTVDLRAETVTVGREAANAVALEGEGKASRRHCQVAPMTGGGWEVVDLKSTNGTRVNGQPVERRRLRPGDVIEVGLSQIRFEDETAPKVPDDVCWLEWTAGERKGDRVPLTATRTSFGRRESSTVVLADKMASGHHAEVVRDLNGYTIRDLGSTNGTLVNGTPVTETMLTHGARVRIGNSRFVFKDPAMAHVEIALEGLEEDDGGWGMMGELDLSRARGGRGGAIVAILLVGALGAGAYMLSKRPSASTAVEVDTANLVADSGFDAGEVVSWTVDDGVPATATRATTGGRPGDGASLVVRHDGKEQRPGFARYVNDLEIAAAGSYKASAWMRREGDGAAALAVQWIRYGNSKTGSTQVTQTVPLGAPAGGAWAQVSRVVSRPGWADAARLVVAVAPGATARVDDVRFESVASAPAGGRFPAGGDAEAVLASSGDLDLVRTATVLLVGATPWARMPDGRTLGGAASFRADDVPAPGEQGAAVRGRLVDAQGEVPASIEWSRAPEGLVAKVKVPGAAACGLTADIVAAHLEGGIGVVGTSGSRTVAAEPSAPLEGVRRALLGEPRRREESNRPPTLVAIDVSGGAEGGQLLVGPADDTGLVRVALAVPGAEAEVRLVTSFDGERQRAQQALRDALTLLDRSPGEGIGRLRQVAEEFAFQEDVRKEALARAAEREERAGVEKRAADEAYGKYQVFRDDASLVDAETRVGALSRQFPADGKTAGQIEMGVRELAAQVAAARALHELRRAGTEVRRLSRLGQLLEEESGYKAVAAVYYDTLVRRYGALGQAATGAPLEAADTETLQKVEEARSRLEALLKDPEIKAALP
jgi:pSer/pThr/pTyr-binding forkhead associated (FHA) protein